MMSLNLVLPILTANWRHTQKKAPKKMWHEGISVKGRLLHNVCN